MKKFWNIYKRRGVNWLAHILRRNWLLHEAINGQMTEGKRSRMKKNTAP